MKIKFSKKYLTILAFGTLMGVLSPTHAQYVTKRSITVNGQVIPIPDDASTGTERAVVGMVQGVTTTDVNNIITNRVPGIIANQASAASASWSKSFLGEQKCVTDPWPGLNNGGAQTVCASVGVDGSISVLEAIYPYQTRLGQHWVNLGVPDAYMTLASSQVIVIPGFTNTDKRDGKLPTSWRVQLRPPEGGISCETPCLYGTN